MGQKPFPVQMAKIRGVADVIFCLDITGSMGSCIVKLRNTLRGFVETIETPYVLEKQMGVVKVSDWRARLLPYRDLMVDDDIPAIIEDFPFVSTAEEFGEQLEDSRVKAKGGGGDGPESTLDAVYRAARCNDWRPAQVAQRFVVVFTDAVTLPLHPSTVGDGMPADVDEVLQVVRMQRVKAVVFGPRCEDYEKLIGTHPLTAGVSRLFDRRQDVLEFFRGPIEPFQEVMKALARSISESIGEFY